MHCRRLGAAALALSTAILMSATFITGADAQKKKKPAPKPKAADSKALIAEGKTVYAKNNCAACHVIAGKGGKIGPDLSTFGKAHTAAVTVVYIREPKKKNPNSIMPAYGPHQINDKQLKALVAYMLSLK